MELKPIKSGGAEIVKSGSVISFGDNSVEFLLDNEDPNTHLEIIFVFEKNEENNNEIKFTMVKEGTMEIRLYASESAIDSGNIDPVKIGAIDDKDILLNFRVRKIGNSRTIDYSIYKTL